MEALSLSTSPPAVLPQRGFVNKLYIYTCVHTPSGTPRSGTPKPSIHSHAAPTGTLCVAYACGESWHTNTSGHVGVE